MFVCLFVPSSLLGGHGGRGGDGAPGLNGTPGLSAGAQDLILSGTKEALQLRTNAGTTALNMGSQGILFVDARGGDGGPGGNGGNGKIIQTGWQRN